MAQTASGNFENCMQLPTQRASVAWTFLPHNSTLRLAFFGTFISPSGWVGFGINPDAPRMTGTRALIGFSDASSGRLVLLPFVLDPGVKVQEYPLASRPLDIDLLGSSAALIGGGGGGVEIRAAIKLVPNRTRVHFVWNRGAYVRGYFPGIHPTAAEDLSSAITVDIVAAVAVEREKNARDGLEKVKIFHGAINGVVWGVLLPIGAAEARYLRPIQAVGSAWFYAHAGVQISAVLIGTVGFGLGIKLGELSPAKTSGLHRKLGVAAFVAAWLQAAALFFRPKSTNKYRKYWKSYHHLVGYACVVLGIVNVFQGFQFAENYDSSSYVKLGYCLWLSTLLGLCIVMEVNSWVIFCRKSKEEKMKRQGLV
ncbi:hypothetical protein M569_12030 [Genlisea aurea]|uniref:Cytochrome b561 and DOMON domain-containing protein n=1 Tax=Genlisea aurea TaxID=192259 RepID=S8C7J3_9LAMI|nr:hypothetical protein M569_12030 [Genlisea aurea]